MSIILSPTGKVQLDNISNGHCEYKCSVCSIPFPSYIHSKKMNRKSSFSGVHCHTLLNPITVEVCSDLNVISMCLFSVSVCMSLSLSLKHTQTHTHPHAPDRHTYTVTDPPKNVRITLPDGPNVYQCVADAMPAPTFKWSR